MSRLFLNRKLGQGITMRLKDDADPVLVLEQLKADGIVIGVLEGDRRGQVKVVLSAPEGLLILRDELLEPIRSEDRQ